MLDTRDPSKPRVVSKLQNPPGTSVEDVVVYTAPYGPRAGRDIAVQGIQVCGGPRTDTGFFRGLQVFDVTNPAQPVELGLLSTGCCARGLHELEVQHRADLQRSFVYASVPTSEYADASSPSGRRDHQGKGDFRLIDVTNPSLPWEVSNWGVHRNLGGPPAAGLGCDPDAEYGHSVEPRADGKVAWVAYWDSGFIALDLTDPATPVYKGRTSYPADADGDGHSSNFDEGRKLLFAADEDFGKTCGSGTEKGFGYLRVYDYSSLGAPSADRQLQDAERLREQGRQRGRLHDPQPAAVRHGPLRVLVHGRHPRARREGPAQRARGRLLRAAVGQQPDPAVPARDAHQRHAGLGRGLRRGPQARVRERHELGPLDPQAHEVGHPSPGPAVPPARASGTFVRIGESPLPIRQC